MMDALMGRRQIWLALAVVATLAGCGGSGTSSAERTKLTNQLSAQASQSGLAPDLAGCVTQQAHGLPISQLREVVNAGSNPSPSAKRVVVRLYTTCLSQGKGVSALRARIVAGFVNAQASLPPSFTSCLTSKADATTPAQLSALLSTYADQNRAAAQAAARQLGVSMALQCFDDPQVFSSFRAALLVPVRRGLQASHLSATFQRCVLNKAAQIPVSQFKQAAINPAGAHSLGVTLGQRAASACIASGAKP